MNYEFKENSLYNSENVNVMNGDLNNTKSYLHIKQFSDYCPLDNVNYFDESCQGDITSELPPELLPIPTLVIGIVFYNEHVSELIRSVISISEQIKELRDIGCRIQIIIVGDGIKQMDPSCTDFFKILYTKSNQDVALWNEMIDKLNIEKKQTFVIQRQNSYDNTRSFIKLPTTYEDICLLPITLILKTENRRKHNSQEWIINAFSKDAFINTKIDDSRFIFMTDCGTLFEPMCIKRLTKYMMENPKCVGCTGRQRVMTAEQQDCISETLSAKFLRTIQLVDYEVSYATYTGAFSLVGSLPVLPGPCSFFRYTGLLAVRHSETALEHYNKLVATNIENTNICIENVKLAEDRIPSYSIITHGVSGAYTAWVDGAIFRFQSESSLEKLILQRRRWINGALSCYIWNSFLHPFHILQSKHNFFRKILIFFLNWLQIFNYIFAMSTYGILAGSLYISLITLFNIEIAYLIIIMCVYFFIVFSHLIVHKFQTFSKWFTIFVISLNTIVFLIVLGGYIYAVISWGGFQHSNIGRLMIEYTTIVVLVLPLFMALISLDLKSIFYVGVGYPIYWIFLPTICGTFVLYSITRLSDITWGNRISSEKSSFENSSDEDIILLKKKMSMFSNFVFILVFILNIGICCALIFLYIYDMVIAIILMSIVGIIVIQCFFSVIYFLGKHISGMTYKQRHN